MKPNYDFSPINTDTISHDLRRFCGPRFNAFNTAAHREEPGKFFQRAVWKSITKSNANDEDGERWDGME